MKKQSGSILVLSAIAIVAIGIGILSRTLLRQDEILAGLQKEKIELDELRAANESLKALRVDTAELVRLRRENADLPKLRSQAWRLREAMRSQDSQEPGMMRQLRSENEQLRQQKRELQELPNRAACIKNLELIDAAKKQWAEQNGLQNGEVVTMEVLAPFFPNGFPTCPGGGHYSVNRAGAPPICSIPGHSMR